MKSIARLLFASVGLSLILADSVKAEDAPTPIEIEAVALGRPVDYAQDIAPILESNCVACHNVAIDEGDLSLEDVAAMLKGGGRGPTVVPGKPDEGLLLAVASHRREPLMPPPENDVEAKPLTPRELGLIKQWILEGAGQGQAPAGSTIDWRALPAHLQAVHSVDLTGDGRFVAAGRGNQLDLYDLATRASAVRLVDPNLSNLGEGGNRFYTHGAAHRDVVHAIAFHPEGNLLATAGYRCVKLWRRAGLGETRPLDVGPLTAMAASKDGTLFAVAASNEVRLMESESGEQRGQWTTETEVVAVAISEDRALLAAGCSDQSITVWKVESSEPFPPFKTPSPITALTFAGAELVTGHDDGVIRLWSPGNDRPKREIRGPASRIQLLATVATEPQRAVATGADGTTRVLNLEDGNELRAISHGKGPTAVSPDGKLLASGDQNGIIRIWNLDDGKQVAEAKTGLPAQRAFAAAQTEIDWRKQLAAVSESRLKAAEAALTDRKQIHAKAIEARDAAAKTQEMARAAEQEASAAAKSAADEAAGKPDDAELKKKVEATAKSADAARQKVTEAEDSLRSAERAIELANSAMATIEEQRAARQKEKQVADESVAAAEKTLAHAKSSSEVLPAVTAMAFSPSGDRVAICDAEKTLQTIATDGRSLDFAPDVTATAVATIADGDVVVIGDDRIPRRIDVTGEWEYSGVIGPPQDAPLDFSRSEFVDRVLALAFSPDGRLLATGGGEPSRSGELKLWDVATRRLLQTIPDAHSDTVQAVTFSQDGNVLASAAADKFARTFDVSAVDQQTPTLIRTFEGHTDHVLGVAIKADRTTVATASADQSVKVWDAVTGEQRRTLTDFGKQVTSIQFAGLSDTFVTAGGDKIVRLQNASDGKTARAFSDAAEYVHAAAVSNDGNTVVAGGDDGVVFVWDGATGKVRHRLEPAGQAPHATAAK